MNLSPEEKQLGKQNFDEATGTTRRQFLATIGLVGGTAAVAGLGHKYFNYGPKLDDRLRVGIIGTGDEGNVLIGALNPDYIDVVALCDIRPYSRHRAFYGDWYSEGAHAARPGLLKVYEREGWTDRAAAEKHVKVYDKDYNDLLNDKNVEAVIIAAPLHMHHPMAIAAMRKGKHVLTEKLMGHDVAQCKEMARVAAETKLILAVGHQRHYSILYDNAVQQIRQGLIGDIHHIRAQWHRNNLPGNDSWQPPLPEPKDYTFEKYDAEVKAAGIDKRKLDVLAKGHPLYAQLRSWQGELKKAPPEKKAEWDAKIKQTLAQLSDIEIAEIVGPKYGYQSITLPIGRERSALEELIRWRLFERTAGGLMAELGSHQLDAASIFISAMSPPGTHVHPLTVTGYGVRNVFPADRDCDDHVHCMFEFPAPGYYDKKDPTKVADENKKVVVSYSSINGNGFGGYGEIVFGTKGTLILEQEQDAMLFKGSSTSTRIEVKQTGKGPAMDTYETGGGAAVAQAATAGNTSRGYREEIEHWAWCIRNPAPENKPHCTPEVALGDAVIALTSNIAIAKRERIKFDPAWFDPLRDDTPEGKPPRQASQVS
jgi:predicted dehydrogenase